MRYLKYILIFLLISTQAKSQDVDSLFQVARKLAFNKERQAARDVCNQILDKKPRYSDAAILKGRTYAWDKMYDSAIVSFEHVFLYKPNYKDGLSAMIDVLMWSKDYPEALKYADIAIGYYATVEDFYIKKAQILFKMEEDEKAQDVLSEVLELNPYNDKANALLNKEDKQVKRNKVEVLYDFEFFKVPYVRRRHLTALTYSNKTPIGSVFVRFRVNDVVSSGEQIFQSNLGYQAEFDAYPKIIDGLYSYVSYGYGFNRLFPKHRAGFELFKSLPASFEASLGFRYMQFISSTDDSKSNIFVLTGSIGKYYKNYWISFRPFITPKDIGVSQSYFLTLRYYLAADQFIFVMGGIGSSPDEGSGDLVDLDIYQLNKQKLKIGYEGPIGDKWYLKSRVGYEYAEYDLSKYRSQWNFTLGVSYKF